MLTQRLPKNCPSCKQPWHDQQRVVRAVFTSVFVFSSIAVIGGRNRLSSDQDGGLLAVLALKGQIPLWPIHLLVALGLIGLLGMAYFEFIKTDRHYHCGNCGHEVNVPKRQWSLAEKMFVGIISCGLTLFVLLLLALVIVW